MKDDRLFLYYMLERCHRITRFVEPGRETFMASEELQDAVIRYVEVIGEAAKRVSTAARGRLASLDWKAICGMRDVPIHDYIGVDLDEVWNVASNRIPELQAPLAGDFLNGLRGNSCEKGRLPTGLQATSLPHCVNHFE